MKLKIEQGIFFPVRNFYCVVLQIFSLESQKKSSVSSQRHYIYVRLVLVADTWDEFHKTNIITLMYFLSSEIYIYTFIHYNVKILISM